MKITMKPLRSRSVQFQIETDDPEELRKAVSAIVQASKNERISSEASRPRAAPEEIKPLSGSEQT